MSFKFNCWFRFWIFLTCFVFIMLSFVLFAYVKVYAVVPVSNKQITASHAQLKKIFLNASQPAHSQVILLPENSLLTRKFVTRVIRVSFFQIENSYQVARGRGTGSKRFLVVPRQAQILVHAKQAKNKTVYSYTTKRFQQRHKKHLKRING